MPRVSVVPALPVPPYSSGAIKWNFSPDLESEITTLAAYCKAQQLQRDSLTSCVKDLEHDADDSDTVDGANTNRATLLAHNEGDAGLKKIFLDTLAELLCYRKDPTFVTSTAMMYTETRVTIVAARNSTPAGKTWSDKDVAMLEYLAEVMERISADEPLTTGTIPELQRTLVEYYSSRIRHHTKEAMFHEGGKTGMPFFGNKACGGVLSGHMPVHDFAELVETLSYSTNFYTKLKNNLTSNKLRRVVDELGHIRRPMQGAEALAYIAQQCPGFRDIKVVLLDSLPARKVEARALPKDKFPLTPKLEQDFLTEVKKRKNLHAEMTLVAYLLSGCRDISEVFPYLGISKKTCLLCGHLLQRLGYFETRGNYGKCYSQWTFVHTLWIGHRMVERVQAALCGLRDTLLAEGSKEKVPHRDQEKESVMAGPVPPEYARTATLFNRVVEDPRSLAREAEWFVLKARNYRKPENEKTSALAPQAQNSTDVQDETDCLKSAAPATVARSPQCPACKTESKLTHTCKLCGNATHCSLDCYRTDWYRHKFLCRLGRPIDTTDLLVLACHENEFPMDDDVASQYGFKCFASGRDRVRLFQLYRQPFLDWGIAEDELRSAVAQDKLKEMLTFRCEQTREPDMIQDARWLAREADFGANREGPGIAPLYEAAWEELLSPEDKRVPLLELQPLEKRNALVFYTQIRNGYKPDADEDNWISLGFCTAATPAHEQQLASAYRSLVTIARCPFQEFWTAMKESRVVGLFEEYRLADQICQLRNFTDLMSKVKKWHESVWELKRFVRLNRPHPFRAVQVDYGFINCQNARQQMQLQEVYRSYFDRGEDEMELHRACIAGRLASYLQSVLGTFSAPHDLFRNFYPLNRFPAIMGMVTDSVMVCPESSLEDVIGLDTYNGQEQVTFAIPDDEAENMTASIHQKAAFLGRGLGKRYYPGPNGMVIEQLTFE